MRVNPKWQKVVKAVILLGSLYVFYYCWVSFPIISSYGAKNLCSCVFVGGRLETDVKQEELAEFPIKFGSYHVNYIDSSVSGSVLGLASSKAVFRNGFGCTLLRQLTEEELRRQRFKTPAVAKINRDTIAWPMGDRLKGLSPTVNTARIQQCLQEAMQEESPEQLERTRALVVLYDGELIAEKYAAGFGPGSRMLGWSMAKSVTAALIGVLVKAGKLAPGLPAPVPEWQQGNDPRKAITLENLLQQTSGLQYQEDYTKSSEATDMLFKKGDMAAFTASRRLQHTPGTFFNYSSGNSNILSRIIRHMVGEDEYHSFPAVQLFHKLGIYGAVLEPDASGTFVGSSYLWATARDWARFGLLYYNDGVYNGQRILPEGWVAKTVTPVAADPLKHYGYQFWLNGLREAGSTNRIFPGVPADMFHADGYGGQEVYIVPSKKLVLVRLGLHDGDDNTLLKKLIAALPAR